MGTKNKKQQQQAMAKREQQIRKSADHLYFQLQGCACRAIYQTIGNYFFQCRFL